MFEKHFFTKEPSELEKFNQWLTDESRIVITFHQNPDGDAIGSALGLSHFLKAAGCTNINLISPTEVAEYLKWMPGADEILEFGSDSALETLEKAELIFCLDFSGLSRLREMAGKVENSNAKIIVVDHHEEPEDFGDLYYWDVYASSTCELIYNFIKDLGKTDLINLDGATCLYTGILTDTGAFKYSSTTSKVHEIAAKLLEKGVSPTEVQRNLFDKNPFEKLKFLGFALNEKLKFLPDYRVAYMAISDEELKRYNSRPGDTEGMVNYGLSIENSVMSVLFTEREGTVRISFRSIHDFSVADFAREHFNGGGHKNAAGGRSSLSLDKTVEKFLSLLPDLKEDLLKQAN